MKNALILHGTDFSKTKKEKFGNWFPWLKKELEQKGYKVWLPELPEAWQPDLKRYTNFIQKKFKFTKETVLVGHSSGAAAIPGLLQVNNKKIDKAILVAPFYKDEGWNCQGLFELVFNWQKIKKLANKFIILHSKDDPYVKPEQAYYMQKKLDCQLIMKEKEGHFNLENSKKYKKFPLLLKLI